MTTGTVTIDPSADVLTIVSVFTTTPEQQGAVLELLNGNADTWLRHLDGFIAASIHPSVDGSTIVNYAQWRDPEAVAAMLADPRARHHQAQVAALATVVPIRCTVDAVHRTPIDAAGPR
jgi:quinol monooxygenase YgiN